MNNEDLVGRILKSVFFKTATKKAGKYAGTGLAVLELLREALIKAKDIAKNENKGIGQVLAERITTLSRMVKAYATGQYRIIPWATILKVIAGLIYFISPIDLIPDFLPLVGLSDDLALVMWLFTSLKTDIDNFIAWEKGELITE
ncbi:YkvA family protein [Arcicella lustrica]|uniref:YkvA family protein n=1 Tax=Arcicella lustrica TaxID=2984196 RepID=A0ABU5SN57_9BACT|nr:YkvA family protein [Arcicella sp. DC25W]MEA5428750.1 YkvA family protein [Arcicella sp. DC25W]